MESHLCVLSCGQDLEEVTVVESEAFVSQDKVDNLCNVL